MKDYKLAESEYRFMKIVWENQPLTSANLVKLCAEKLGWKAEKGLDDMCRDSWNWQKNNPNGYQK